MYERLLHMMNSTAAPRVLVVGDFMLDNYLYGNIDRISPEAPVMVLNVTDRQERPGGAGSVAADLAGLGAEVACLGVVGADRNADQLRAMLGELGPVNVEGLITADDRPTTCKQRIIGLAQYRHRQQLMRVDEECSRDVNDDQRRQLLKQLELLLPTCDVVCLTDYGKGVLCAPLCQAVIATAAEYGKKVLVDPAAISDYRRYRGAWLVKPNRRELAVAAGMSVDGRESWQAAAEAVARDHDIANVVVTLDKQGSFLYCRGDADHPATGELVATRSRSVYDVTGAGDIVLAMLGLLVGARYEGIDPPNLTEIVALANLAGGLEVERFGSVPVSRDEIVGELVREHSLAAGKLRSPEALLNELRWHRQQNLKIVFTNGCFDLLHSGHIDLLSKAKQQGDVLVVAINSDRSVSELKGPERPINKEQDRAALLSALEAVNYVVIFDEPTPLALIETISPDVLVKGTDWSGAVVGQEWVEAHGGRVALVPLSKGRSTTNIIELVLQKTAQRAEDGGDVS